MNVVVLGAGGQLGAETVRYCRERGDDVVALAHDALDVRDESAVQSVLRSTRPALVINCAAWTAVDACEASPERAHAVNALGAANVAESVTTVGAHLVHISTDYVFDGTLDRPYSENDAPNPLGVYGRSKLAGELAVLQRAPTATVVRTSWLCGALGPNMVKTVLGLASRNQPLRFVNDQRGCPTFTADLAPLLRVLGDQRVSGVVHATNQRSVSWYEFTREVLECAGYDPSCVAPITTDELQPPRPAPRPRNSVLDNAVLRSLGIPLLRDFREPLAELVVHLSRQ